MNWTPERVDLLKNLWAEGLSTAQIANQLGGVTRNAVIGKIHRLGLSVARKKSARQKVQRAETSRKSRKFNHGPSTAQQKARARENYMNAAGPLDCDPPPHERIGLMQLTERTCKWPIGDLKDDDFGFCGRTKPNDGYPYCDYHSRFAYQPVQSRNTKREAA